MAVNYDDERFNQVNQETNKAIENVNNMYNNMQSQADKYYQDQIKAAEEYGNQQAQIQQANTDFAIEQINQQKEQAQKDYTREQKGAYVDWQKESNQYGVNAEQLASAGLNRTGYSESSQVSMYNTYQNRVSQARDTYNRAVLDYDNGIKEAQLTNNAKLAEIAYNSLQTKLELSLNGFQYQNKLLESQLAALNQERDRGYAKWQDVLKQINTENALAEEKRQFNTSINARYGGSSGGSSSSTKASIKKGGSSTGNKYQDMLNAGLKAINLTQKIGTNLGKLSPMKTSAGQKALNYVGQFISGDPNDSRHLTSLDKDNIINYLNKQTKNGMTTDELNYLVNYVNTFYR